eukprot:1695428-Rhodomonas_salina.7
MHTLTQYRTSRYRTPHIIHTLGQDCAGRCAVSYLGTAHHHSETPAAPYAVSVLRITLSQTPCQYRRGVWARRHVRNCRRRSRLIADPYARSVPHIV